MQTTDSIQQDRQLLAKAEQYARDTLKAHHHTDLLFHNIEHTEQVVKAAHLIGKNSGLTQEELNTVALAAWFHDLGYTQIYIGHEMVSMQIAEDFFRNEGLPEERIQVITHLIEATKLTQEPRNLLEEVIKDADLYNLSTPLALEHTANLRVEWKTFCNQEYDELEWLKLNLGFFKNHRYFTEYSKEYLTPQKDIHTKALKKKYKKLKKKEEAEVLDERALQSQAELERLNAEVEGWNRKYGKLTQKYEKLKGLKPDRGIETMFRSTYRTHINLSSIADNKANILLSINAIIISILFSNLVNQVSDHPVIVFPGIFMLTVSVTTIVFAILSTRPSVSSGVFTREDILNKRTNLLFFGNFHRMDLDIYLWGIKEMMADGEYLYGSMSKDIYFLGRVLAKKFTLLRIAYTVFMYGMILAVIGFGIAFYWESRSGGGG
ncbi:MAG: Pycsar system effector family protein [Bacteroidota bacterium]